MHRAIECETDYGTADLTGLAEERYRRLD